MFASRRVVAVITMTHVHTSLERIRTIENKKTRRDNGGNQIKRRLMIIDKRLCSCSRSVWKSPSCPFTAVRVYLLHCCVTTDRKTRSAINTNPFVRSFVRSFLSITLRYCVRCSRTRPDVYELCMRTEHDEITLPNLKCCRRIDDAFRLRLEFPFEKRGDNRKKESYFKGEGKR